MLSRQPLSRIRSAQCHLPMLLRLSWRTTSLASRPLPDERSCSGGDPVVSGLPTMVLHLRGKPAVWISCVAADELGN